MEKGGEGSQGVERALRPVREKAIGKGEKEGRKGEGKAVREKRVR